MKTSKSRLAVYPGTFDPITNGHIDILRRSLAMFDGVVVAIAKNVRKAPMFPIDQRIAFIKQAMGAEDGRIEYDSFEGLLVDYCRRRGATTIIRGLRAPVDFEYEFQFAVMNRRLAPDVDTMFLMTAEENFFVSSSLVKEVAGFGGDVSGLVPDPVSRALSKKRTKGKRK